MRYLDVLGIRRVQVQKTFQNCNAFSISIVSMFYVQRDLFVYVLLGFKYFF